MDERNERKLKVKALAFDLPADPLQMCALPVISHTPSAGSPKPLHTYMHVSHKQQTHSSVGSKTEREAYTFLSEVERKIEMRRDREKAQELSRLTQGSGSVCDYAIRFRTLAVEGGWNSTALYDVYLKGLAAPIQDLLVPLDLPPDLDCFVVLAIQTDNRISQLRPQRSGRSVAKERPPRYQTPDLDMIGLVVNFDIEWTQVRAEQRMECIEVRVVHDKQKSLALLEELTRLFCVLHNVFLGSEIVHPYNDAAFLQLCEWTNGEWEYQGSFAAAKLRLAETMSDVLKGNLTWDFKYYMKECVAVWKAIGCQRTQQDDVCETTSEKRVTTVSSEMIKFIDKCAGCFAACHLPLLQTVLQMRANEMDKIKVRHFNNQVAIFKAMMRGWAKHEDKPNPERLLTVLTDANLPVPSQLNEEHTHHSHRVGSQGSRQRPAQR
ncbi:hypothetical protein F2P81_025334 [Scophthalmus maximus]|uniref:Retrotransposon gag domain-containing protein n=1 Tax=Scophthalmus maximus TaxID=52904 RepID=A0A6A4RTS9_SCOMX|nr:hypothetical protein F2P81_025334 [Scophthalmus maximus]